MTGLKFVKFKKGLSCGRGTELKIIFVRRYLNIFLLEQRKSMNHLFKESRAYIARRRMGTVALSML